MNIHERFTLEMARNMVIFYNNFLPWEQGRFFKPFLREDKDSFVVHSQFIMAIAD